MTRKNQIIEDTLAFELPSPREVVVQRITLTLRAIAEAINRCDVGWCGVDGPHWALNADKDRSWPLREMAMVSDDRIDDLNAALYGAGVLITRGQGRGLALLQMVSDGPASDLLSLRESSADGLIEDPYLEAAQTLAVLMVEVDRIGLV